MNLQNMIIAQHVFSKRVRHDINLLNVNNVNKVK